MIRTVLTASLAAAAVAFAASAEDVVIDISSVDFNDPAQVSAVYAKVVEASETICNELYIEAAPRQVGYFEAARMYAACVKVTVDDTVKAAELPALSAAHASAGSEFAVASN